MVRKVGGAMTGGNLSKQQIIDKTCALFNGPSFKVAVGATEPREFFEFVAEQMGLRFEERLGKPELARLIVGATGGAWGKNCDSTYSPSGGGGTVTNEGLQRVLESAERFLANSQMGRQKLAVDVRPDASALRVFQNMTYSEWYALGEFIDNSLTSAQQNHQELVSVNGKDYRLRVDVAIDGENGVIQISDNAAGISRSHLGSAVRTGSLPIDSSTGLSIHGVGMKAAAFWWGARLTIETYPIKETVGFKLVIDLDEIDERRSGEIEVEEVRHRGFPGTTIRIEKLRRGIPQRRTVGKIRSYLPSIYRKFLVGGSELGENKGPSKGPD
jgi:hypothetical protein